MKHRALTEAELSALSPDDLRALQKATQALANESQRQTAHYQRQADRMRKRLEAIAARGNE